MNYILLLLLFVFSNSYAAEECQDKAYDVVEFTINIKSMQNKPWQIEHNGCQLSQIVWEDICIQNDEEFICSGKGMYTGSDFIEQEATNKNSCFMGILCGDALNIMEYLYIAIVFFLIFIISIFMIRRFFKRL